MPDITIVNLAGRKVPFSPTEHSALKAIQRQNIDWMHACGTKGRCTTCRMIIIEGLENLSQLSESEKKYRSEGRLKSNERLTCQTKVLGDIVIRVPEATKFPHVKYSE